MAINKIVYDGDTLIDLTGDTVTPETLAEGATAHNKSGEQIMGAMRGGSPVEIEPFWRYEDGNNFIDMVAVSFGGIVCYYCVISAMDGLSGSITADDGTLYDLRDYGGKFLPAVTPDGTPAAPDNFNATFAAIAGGTQNTSITLSFLYQMGLNQTGIEIKTTGNDLSFMLSPGVIFLGMCRNQEAEPNALAVRSGETGTVQKTVKTLTGTSGAYTVDGYIVSVMLVDSKTKEQVLADIKYSAMTSSVNNTVTIDCATAPSNPLYVVILYL